MNVTRLIGWMAVGTTLGLATACSQNARAQAPSGNTPGVQSVVLNVEGMTCASCSAVVRLALQRIEGVKEAKVSRSERRATIEYDSSKVTPQQLVDAVNKAGYQASLPATTGS